MDILNNSRNRNTLTLGKAVRVALLMIALAFPLAGMTGQAGEVNLRGATVEEEAGIIETLAGFYRALSQGEDFEEISEQYLSRGYFDQPELTFENLSESVWRPVFNNAVSGSGPGSAGLKWPGAATSRVVSIQREADRYTLKQIMDVTGYYIDAGSVREEEDRIIVRMEHDPLKEKAADHSDYFVKSLEHEVVFVREQGQWKIDRFDDGIAVMQMDIDNPYGPVFLIWIEDIDPVTTPFGPLVSKVIPRSIVRDAFNMEFRLEDH